MDTFAPTRAIPPSRAHLQPSKAAVQGNSSILDKSMYMNPLMTPITKKIKMATATFAPRVIVCNPRQPVASSSLAIQPCF